MSVKIVQNTTFPGLERCACCREPTSFWCRKRDVALCKKCGRDKVIADVPTKDQWLASGAKDAAPPRKR